MGGGTGEIGRGGVKRTLITISTEECIELLNHHVLYLKLIQHCMLTIL